MRRVHALRLDVRATCNSVRLDGMPMLDFAYSGVARLGLVWRDKMTQAVA